MSTFVFDLTKLNTEKDWREFQSVMDGIQDAQNKELEKLEKDLDLSPACAVDVQYLRTRSRWTQKMENELIRLHKAGTPPNIMEWPPKGDPLRYTHE